MAENTSIQKKGKLELMLDSRTATFKDLCPAIRPDALIKNVLTAVYMNPQLQRCTPESIVIATQDALALGLEIGTSLAHANLVPFGDKARMIPGYKGLCYLAHEYEEILIDTFIVYENDPCEITYVGHDGEPSIIHKPCMKGERGPILGAYAIARMKTDQLKVEWMTVEDIEHVRNSGNGKTNPAWKTHWPEMARKTVLKRLAKRIPTGPGSRLAAAVGHDNDMETVLDGAFSMTPPPEPEEEKPASEQVVEVKAEEPKQELTKLENMLALIAQSKDDAQLQQLTGAIKALPDDEQKAAKAAYALRKAELRKGEVRA